MATRDKAGRKWLSSAKRALSSHMRDKRNQLVAQFRASCGLFAASRRETKNTRAGWLCWQSGANPSLPAIWGVQGDFAKLQGQRRLIPAEGPRISMGWVGLSLIQGAGRPSFHSREGRFRNAAPVLFGDIHAAQFNVRFRAPFGHQRMAGLCRRVTKAEIRKNWCALPTQ